MNRFALLAALALAGCTFSVSLPYAPVLGSAIGAHSSIDDLGNGDMKTSSTPTTKTDAKAGVGDKALDALKPAVPVVVEKATKAEAVVEEKKVETPPAK